MKSTCVSCAARVVQTFISGMYMVKPDALERDPFNMLELDKFVQRLKFNKSCDECGLTAVLLKHTPHVLLHVLVEILHHVFVTNDVPNTWRIILFRMLTKTKKTKIASEFRSVANLRLLYNLLI